MNIYNGEHLRWWASIFDEYIASALFGVQIANMVLPCSQFSLHSLQSQLVSMPWILFQTKSAPVLFLPPRCPDVFPANGGGHMFPGTGLLRDICPASSSSFSSGSGSPPPPLLGVMCARPSLMRDQSGRGEQVGQAHLGTRCWAKHGSKVLLAIVFSCQFPCFESKPGGNNLWKIYNARFLEYSTTWQHMNCELLRWYNRGLANAEQVLEIGYGLKLQQKLIEKYKTIQQVMQPLAWCWVNAGNRLPTRSLCLPDTRDTNTLGHQCQIDCSIFFWE